MVQLTDRPVPSISPDELLIKVHYTTLNRTDCGFRSGRPSVVRLFSGIRRPKIQILGSEYAGEVVKVGNNVSSFKIGDRVFGISQKRFGAHAEFLSVNVSDPVEIMPESFSFKDCAGITEGFFLAFNYVEKMQLMNDTHVLINGASGSIGSAAVQLCSYFGADITAVCRKKDFDLILSLGASRCIDYTTENFEEKNIKCDYILDAVGKSTFGKCKSILTDQGVYFSTEFGPYAQNAFLPLWTLLFSQKKMKFPLPNETKEDVIFLKKLLKTGDYRPVIDRTYPLEQIREAIEYVESETKVGNVLIQVAK